MSFDMNKKVAYDNIQSRLGGVMHLHRWRRTFFIIAGIAAVVFVLLAMLDSGPHLRSGRSEPDWGTILQTVAAIIGGVNALLGTIGSFSKPRASRFRQNSRTYKGDDTVIVEIFDGYDNNDRPLYREYECHPLK